MAETTGQRSALEQIYRLYDTHTVPFPIVEPWTWPKPYIEPDPYPTIPPWRKPYSEAPVLFPKPVISEEVRPEKSDGASTQYYKLPKNVEDLIDLIEYKNMNFAIGNIFKACFRLGEKADTDRAYDLRKIIFFAQRELDRVLADGEKK